MEVKRPRPGVVERGRVLTISVRVTAICGGCRSMSKHRDILQRSRKRKRRLREKIALEMDEK